LESAYGELKTPPDEIEQLFADLWHWSFRSSGG